MKMEYFTKKGVEQVKEKYKSEIGKEFYFNESKIKYKLSFIVEQESRCPNGYNVLFYSDQNVFAEIFDFMKLNEIKYNFHDFETTNIEC